MCVWLAGPARHRRSGPADRVRCPAGSHPEAYLRLAHHDRALGQPYFPKRGTAGPRRTQSTVDSSITRSAGKPSAPAESESPGVGGREEAPPPVADGLPGLHLAEGLRRHTDLDTTVRGRHRQRKRHLNEVACIVPNRRAKHRHSAQRLGHAVECFQRRLKCSGWSCCSCT